VAAIVHDPAALRDESLARSVAAAVRLAVTNVRLQADVQGRVLEVAASRRRLVEASDVERRRLSEQLRVGAESRLARVAVELEQLAADGAAPALGELAAELEATRSDLAHFAQGVHPRALTEGGLPAALQALAAQAAVPVELDVTAGRMPPAHEAALYFVCSEALANVAKYANASVARIAVSADNAHLRAKVTDDGSGGADPAAGSGLRGLADRVEALGGRLLVDSRRGIGTTVAAVLPRTGAEAS
jgi:signal transduction histidine kinase